MTITQKLKMFKQTKMQKIKVLMTVVAIFGLATITMAQVPSYVPTTGLLGWWPFNGNANESTTSVTPSTNSASLTVDRFSNANCAYSFNGASMIKYVGNNPLSTIGNTTQNWSFNFWLKASNSNGGNILGSFGWGYYLYLTNTNKVGVSFVNSSLNWTTCTSLSSVSVNSWCMVTITKTNSTIQVIINNVIDNTITSIPDIAAYGEHNSWFGANGQDNSDFFQGSLDDIGIWNRALTQQEITALNGCQLSVNTHPTNQTINVNNNAQFVVSSSDTNATYQWQTDLGVGFQNVSNAGQYSGASSDTLVVSNVSVSNNNQQFRCIVNSVNCADTSEIAVLTVSTLGIEEIMNQSILTLYPNPTQSSFEIQTNLVYTKIQIRDMQGRIVKTENVGKTIHIASLQTGTYLVELLDEISTVIAVQKMIKE